MDTPFKDTPKEVVDFLYQESKDRLDSQLVAKDRLDKKYTLYIGYCLAYVVFFLNFYASLHNTLMLPSIVIQLIFFLICIFINFKSYVYGIQGSFPEDIFKDIYYQSSLNANKSAFAKTLNQVIIKNHKTQIFRAFALDYIVIANICFQLPLVIAILLSL